MDRIAKRIEAGKTVGTYVNPIVPKTPRERINAATVYLANESKSVGICVYTHTGTKACFIAGLRPQTAPVYAFTPDIHVCRSLSLHFGVRAHLIVPSDDPNETLLQMIAILKEKGYAETGDSVVVVSDLVAGKETLHAIHVHEIK
jgi:pyruvate kinase